MIERITAANVLLFKEVRLRALQDAPHAFGSTYAKEAQFTEVDQPWQSAGRSRQTFLFEL